MSSENELAVSVIICVYNGERYLAECLESVLLQTLENMEIICVDDASTDATPQILDKYNDHITILKNDKNCMAGESRNRGLAAAQGEYIIFLDADDVFEPDMLEKAYQKAHFNNADICIFREDVFGDNVKSRQSYPYAEMLMKRLGEMEAFAPPEYRDILFNLWNGWAWDKLFRREFLLDAGLKFPDIQTSEDGFLVHAAMATVDKISFLNEVLVHHRTGNGSSLSNIRDQAWESCLIYLKELMRYLKQHNLFSTFERSYMNWAADFLYWNYRTLNEENRKQLACKMRYFFSEICTIGQYEVPVFYNAFSQWFVERIVSGNESDIPLTEGGCYQLTYQLNDLKLEKFHKYIAGYFQSVAIWGAGIRGQAFARVYGEKWPELRSVYDVDQKKQGYRLHSGLVIKRFEKKQKEAECILVMNAAHTQSVYRDLKGEHVTLFDMNTYLTLPIGIEECLIDCKNSGLQVCGMSADGGTDGE